MKTCSDHLIQNHGYTKEEAQKLIRDYKNGDVPRLCDNMVATVDCQLCTASRKVYGSRRKNHLLKHVRNQHAKTASEAMHLIYIWSGLRSDTSAGSGNLAAKVLDPVDGSTSIDPALMK